VRSLFLFCLFITTFVLQPLVANESPVIEYPQHSQKKLYQSKLKCEKPLATGSFQSCHLVVLRENQPVENTEIFISGGMPQHQHGLPTAPKLVWSEEKKYYEVLGLKFSMSGDWSLNFKINAKTENLKDQIILPVEVE